MNQKWLGIDLGLATIGRAFLEEFEDSNVRLLEFGTIETSKELTTSQRLLEIEQDIIELIATYQPSRIAIEMPFFGRSIKAAGINSCFTTQSKNGCKNNHDDQSYGFDWRKYWYFLAF